MAKIMAFSTHSSPFSSRTAPPQAEINMVPLIDVMLVLLVIVLMTAPIITQAIAVNLPKTDAVTVQKNPEKPLVLSFNAQGELFWDTETRASVSQDAWTQRLETWAKEHPQGEIRLQADIKTPYEPIAQIMATASRLGITRLGLMSQPKL
jgi:biopolymer transport protein ExbD